MKHGVVIAVMVVWFAACGGGPVGVPDADAVTPDGELDAERPAHALGMSDVSILAPLPTALAQPVLMKLDNDGAPVLSELQASTYVLGTNDVGPKTGEIIRYRDFHLVAARFDLCDRVRAEACPPNVEGRLRLVFQPLVATTTTIIAQDIAVHLFYPIPAVDVDATILELRRLAAVQDQPAGAPLTVSPALAAHDATYATALRALISKYARADRLVRCTVIGQERTSAAFAWVFRGVDIQPDHSYVSIQIPDLVTGEVKQTVLLAGGNVVYDSKPVADAPRGFTLALNGANWANASAAEQLQSLRALTEIQNPLLHDTGNTQCMGCHVAAHLTAIRAASAGVDPLTLSGRFTSSYNTAVPADDLVLRDPRVVRNFGWAGTFPIVSQRVANDTAEVLAEIATRSP